MPLPRPASPSSLVKDLRAFFGERRPHQLLAACLALIVPAGIIGAFWLDAKTNIMPGPQVIYVENWPAERSDEEITARQAELQKEREAIQAERQRQFQELERRLGL
jgi:hypothetical protein